MEKKEAMKILKDFHDKSALFSVRTALDTIIPELRESEDERVRKELIRAFKSLNTIKVWNGIERTNILAWLEKQGYTKKDVDDAYLKGICNTKHELEKQGEQKSQRTISAEAKEALYNKPTDEEMKELLRTEYEKGRADAYCEMKSSWSEEDINKPNGGIVMEDFNDGNGFYKVNLAYLNEEQVKEIEELVKRWDCQPKENEDESIISDLLDYFDEDKCLKHEVNDIVKWLKTIKPQPNQKWNEEDEKERKRVVGLLEGWLSTFKETCYAEDCKCGIEWLKSLKNRVQPKQKWSLEDERVIAIINNALTESNTLPDDYDKVYDWLESIKQRIGR